MKSEIIKSKLEELPEDLKKEVLDYVEFLIWKYGGKTRKTRFRFDWEGGLSDLREKYTSIELQHEALTLRRVRK